MSTVFPIHWLGLCLPPAQSWLCHSESTPADAAALLRTTLAAWTRAFGPDDQGTLAAENHLASALNSLGECAEAEALCLGTLEKMRRVLGRDHRHTLTTLANSLSKQGKHVAAAEIERELLVSTTHLLGAEY